MKENLKKQPAEKDSGKNWKILGGMIVIVFILAVIIGFWGARKMWAESEAPKKEGITELEKGLGTNRSKLQDYFVIYVPSELEEIKIEETNMDSYGKIRNSIKARIKDTLIIDFNRAIKRKEGWEQKKDLLFDFQSGKLLPYIVFKKDHNWGANELYETDKTFYFNCLKDSYREFNTKEEVIEFLRDKDSFF